MALMVAAGCTASALAGVVPATQAATTLIVNVRIVAVGSLEPRPGETVFDAGGLTLTPGFIDTHSHHDRGLFDDRAALPVVSQGVTTIVAGNDGSMSYPVRELFELQAKTPAVINVATYVGHGDLRDARPRHQLQHGRGHRACEGSGALRWALRQPCPQ